MRRINPIFAFVRFLDKYLFERVFEAQFVFFLWYSDSLNFGKLTTKIPFTLALESVVLFDSRPPSLLMSDGSSKSRSSSLINSCLVSGLDHRIFNAK